MRYRASQNEDGTYTIYDVPVFSAVKKGKHRKVPVEIDRKWLESAMARARDDEGRGYKYRLHTEHHGDKPTGPAGYFRLSRIADMNVEGDIVPTVFADFVKLPEWVFNAIMANEFPYRSIEINKPGGEPDITTLALLSTHAPFFRYPVLDGDSIDIERPATQELEAAGVVSAFTGDDGRTVALFHDQFSEVPKMERKGTLTVKDGEIVLKSSDSSATFSLMIGDEPRQGEFCIQTPEGVYAATFEDSDKDESGDMADLKAKLKAMEDENKELKAKLKEATASAAKASDDDTSAARFDAIESALEEERNARKAKEAEEAETAEVDARFSAAVESLEGWNLSKATKGKIQKFAAMGQEALDEYVETFKTHVPREGAATFAEEVAAKTGEEGASEVAKFLADNPGKSDEALAVAETYNQYPAMFRRGNGQMIPLSDVLAREVGGAS